MTKYKHLTLDDWLLIEAGLKEGNSFRGIGERIGKDCSTISKEVRSHLVFKKSGAYGRPFNDWTVSTARDAGFQAPARHVHRKKRGFVTALSAASARLPVHSTKRKNAPDWQDRRTSAMDAASSGSVRLRSASTMGQKPRWNTVTCSPEARRGIALSDEEIM